MTNENETAKTADEPLVEQRWIYIGRRYGVAQDFPVVDAWIPLGGDKPVDETEARLFKPGRERNLIGGIYTVQASGRKAVTSAAKWTGETYEDRTLVAAWRAEHDAAMARKRLDKAEGATEQELEALRPLQKRYLRMDSTGRTLLELQVIKYLRMAKWK